MEIKKNERLTRYDLGREELLKRVWEWKEQYSKALHESGMWSQEQIEKTGRSTVIPLRLLLMVI